MAEIRTAPYVWAKDDKGDRYLCPMDELKNPNYVSHEEKDECVDEAFRLKNPKSVPGEGKIRFTTMSKSPN